VDLRKGFQMSISVMLTVVLGALFVAAVWAASAGMFEAGTEQAKEFMEELVP
jgi:hypothetical protein